ncbi:MAG: hypothetical protein KGI69_03440 [Patescibacteria group bacterium]|nr:hypothetical protein [Patescibacteria group bacterium]
MKTTTSTFAKIGVAAGGLLVAAALSVAAQTSGWTAAPSNPPGGNVAAPINVGSSYQAKTGLLGLSSLQFNPGGASNVIAGAVLTAADQYGTVQWATSTSGQSCPNGQYVTGFNVDNTLICGGTQVSLASVSLNDDEQVYVNFTGNTVTLTNMTRGGATLISYHFGSPSGMPQDGKALQLTNVVGRNQPTIIQQPSSSNNYTTIVKIWDGQSGASTYSFDLNYQ